MKPHLRRDSALKALLKPATEKLVQYAKELDPAPSDPFAARVYTGDLDWVRKEARGPYPALRFGVAPHELGLIGALRNCQPDGKVLIGGWTDGDGNVIREPQAVQATRLVGDTLAQIIDVEGPEILADCERPNWARNILARATLLFWITMHYVDQSVTDEVQPEPIDRTSPAWAQISRRNITLPAGLLYEVEAVRQRLAGSETPRKISFSGILELALRELLKRPVDTDDARFYDEEVKDYWFEPDPSDERTISDIIAESAIRGRRPSVDQGSA